MLTEAQKIDLRARVQAGERLDPETARLVTEALRGARMSAAALGKTASKSRKKEKMTDEQLDDDFSSFLPGKVGAGTPAGEDDDGGDDGELRL